MQTRNVRLLIPALECVLFLLTVGLAAYFGERNLWPLFWLSVFVGFVLFAFLTILQTQPVLKALQQMEEAETKLTRRLNGIGCVSIFNMQDSDQRHERNTVTKGIIERGHEFCLLSLTGASYIDASLQRHWDALKPKLDNGAPLRMVLQAPLSTEKLIRDSINGARVPFDSKFDLHRLLQLEARYPNVKIRLAESCIYCAVFFTESEMVYDPYHLGKVAERIENYFFAFHLTRTSAQKMESPHPFFNILKQHFEYQWENGVSIEAYVAKHQIAPSSPIVVKPATTLR